MAEVVSTYTREDNHIIDVYASGAEYDRTAGRLARPASHTLITAENATDYNRKRREKTAESVRLAIVESTNAGLLPAGTPRVNDSSEAVAAAVGMMWEQVVMNSEAYPRDRQAMLEFTARLTGDVPDPRQPDQPAGSEASARLAALTAAANVETARIIARVLADVKRLQESTPTQVIDG
ncbi:MAG TPA: hypothetical protein VIY48_01910 [Candidatus Paceibacterota bacterium]